MDDINHAGVAAPDNDGGDTPNGEDVTTPGDDQGKDANYWQEQAKEQAGRAKRVESQLNDPDFIAKQFEKLHGGNQQAGQQAQYDPDAVAKAAEDAARRTYDQQYIDDQGFPDEIKEAISKVAVAQGVSLRQAAQDGYIQHLMQEHQRAEKVRNASPDAGGGGNAGYVFDPDNPPDVDVSTPEGQKAIEEWEQQLERMRDR